jgi:hypothetical protein
MSLFFLRTTVEDVLKLEIENINMSGTCHSKGGCKMKKRTKEGKSGAMMMVAAIFAVIGLSGCATQRMPAKIVTEVKPVEIKPEYVVVDFDSIEVSDQVRMINNRNSPSQVITFAKSLSAAGRNKEAASIYLDAAKRFNSQDGRFENDCRKAAVREQWMDGDFESARQLLSQIESEQDIYTAASEADSLRKLRKLLVLEAK